MVTLKPIKLLPARERVASALRKAIISKQINEGGHYTGVYGPAAWCISYTSAGAFKSWQEMASLT